MRADDLVTLMQQAESARERAYAPYSKYEVGAALLCEDGTVYSGVNVENASFGLTICAERTAVVSAVAAGKQRFRAIAIAGDAKGDTAPCGACRQFLNEFNPGMAVVYSTPQGTQATTLDRLLPAAFGPQTLRGEK